MLPSFVDESYKRLTDSCVFTYVCDLDANIEINMMNYNRTEVMLSGFFYLTVGVRFLGF